MTITLNKSILKTIATGFNKIIARKVTVPVLAHLLFARGSDGCLHVTGTNLEETLTLKLSDTLPDSSGNESSFLVPFDHLKSLAKSLSRDANAEISFKEETCEVVCAVTVDGQTTSSRIETIPADEFPTETRNVTHRETGPLDAFLNAFRRVSTFASTDPTRHVLNGLFWDSEDAVLVATDGRRLGGVTPKDFNLPESLIIPRTKFLEKQSIKGEKSVDFLVLERNEHQLDFVIAGNTFEYQVHCIDGTYPNYKMVIPDDHASFSGTITIHPDDVSLVKEAVNRLAGDKPDQALVLYADKDCVALVSPGILSDEAPNGDLHIRLVNSSFSKGASDSAACCVNATYLMDFLENGFTTLHVSDGFNAWLVEGNGTGAVMPLRMDTTESILAYAEKYLGSICPEPINQAVENTEIEKEPATMEKPTQPIADATAPTARQNRHEPDLKIVEPPDPMETFNALLNSAQDAVKEANNSVRDLRKAAKNLERSYKDRDKQLTSREKEMQKSLKLFNQLQESLAA